MWEERDEIKFILIAKMKSIYYHINWTRNISLYNWTSQNVDNGSHSYFRLQRYTQITHFLFFKVWQLKYFAKFPDFATLQQDLSLHVSTMHSHFIKLTVIENLPVTHSKFYDHSSDEREKGWKFQFDLIFSPLGLTYQRYFITKNVAMKKFYRRE